MAKTNVVCLPFRLARPRPPAELLDTPDRFAPAVDLQVWIRAAYLGDDGPLYNADHEHLNQATFGVLWTTAPNSRQGRGIIGQAELGEPRGSMGKWGKGRAAQQIVDWFGEIPDFIITIDAIYSATCMDAEFAALIDHELYHCGQERDLFGMPRFTRSGRPVFAMRGHDVEEFVGVVRRFGGAATGTAELVAAANRGPEIAQATIAQACGTCLGKRAA